MHRLMLQGRRAHRKDAVALLAAVLGLLCSSPSLAFVCGDSVCSGPAENRCNCPGDCGAPPAEICTNSVDDDCDGMNACADPSCTTDGTFPCSACGFGGCSGCERCGGCAACPPDCGTAPAAWETSCTDGMDNDCSGKADCADVQCLSACCGNGACNPAENHCNCPADCGPPPSTESNCTDGRDNDCDGSLDCADAECFSLPTCCGNGTCSPWEDPCNCPGDCGNPTASETNCTDLKDNDCDGFGDCGDSDCFNQGATCCGDDLCASPSEVPCNCPGDCGPPPLENCNNSIDDDCDGLQGCNDYLDCSSIGGVSCNFCPFPPCTTCPNGTCTQAERCTGACLQDCGPLAPSEINCTNGVDDDCNGKADCADPQCLSSCCGNGTCNAAETSCNCIADCGLPLSFEAHCVDGRDNDCDGLTDCTDADCLGGTETDCTDALDNDCDGGADCLDFDCCSLTSSCHGECSCCDDGTCDPLETKCTCPEDCGNPPAGETPAVTCQDGIDNDCDARSDCADADCQVDADTDGVAASPCGNDCDDADPTAYPGATEACNDGADDDCDSHIDCADSDCHGQAACCGDGNCDSLEICTCPADCGVLTSEAGLCFDNLDNDCDGVKDCSDRDCCLTQFNACQQQFGCGNGTCATPENVCNCQCDCGYPAATETCSNNADDDCDGLLDCYDPECFGPDNDGDGVNVDLCEFDCDDANATTYPGALELCNNGVDDDCDTRVDCSDLADCAGDPACCDADGACEPFENRCTCPADCGPPASSEAGLCFDGLDNDCDGVDDCDDPDCRATQQACQSPVGCGNGSCQSGETRCNCSRDCGAPPLTETTCGDGQDNDCDTVTDCNDVDCQSLDADQDGFVTSPCGPDCNDNVASMNPTAPENCADGLDNDCDGNYDCNDPGCHGTQACEACCGYLSFINYGYCNTRPAGTCGAASPPESGRGPGTYCQGAVLCCGGFATCLWDAACCANSPGPGFSCAAIANSETDCADGRDNDCDNRVDCVDPDCQIDVDGDGSLAPPCGDDCADANYCATAGGAEDCADGVDNDCDFDTDCADAECQVDADNDGFDSLPCGNDCDDADTAVNPAAAELCSDGADNDCDGGMDCGDSDCQVDADADLVLAPPCGNDCDDSEPTVYPGATEVCDDELDNDCDTAVDCDDTACTTSSACVPPDAIPDPAGGKTRTVSFSVPPPAAATGTSQQTAIRVTLVDLENPVPPNNNPAGPCCPPGNFVTFDTAVNSVCAGGNDQGYRCPPSACPGSSCPAGIGCTEASGSNAQGSCARWVGPPLGFLESNDNPGLGNYRAARLQCRPYYHDWASEPNAGLVNVVGAEVVPSSSYEVSVYAASCKGSEDSCLAVSNPVIMTTRRAGDIATPFQGAPPLTQPNAIDVTNAVNKFRNLAGSPPKVVSQVQPNFPDPNADINAIDIVTVVDNQRGFGYTYSGPCVCPSSVPCNTTACAGASACTGLYGAGATCIKTCSSGPRTGQPCNNNLNCGACIGGPLTGNGAAGIPCDANADCVSNNCGLGVCPTGATPGFCRDRCGRCN